MVNKINAERDLHDAVLRLKNRRHGKIAVHIHLSKLQKARRQPHYIRIATDTFEAQVSGLGGGLFTLQNDDLFYLCEAANLVTLESAINKLKLLFNEDPLVQTVGESERMSFSTWYRLDRDFDLLSQRVEDIYKSAERSRSLALQEEEQQAAKNELQPVEPEVLTRIEQSIRRADLGNLVRRQTICTALPERKLEPIFDEYFISIADLRQSLTPTIDLSANRWLFQYLTQILDGRMMAHITREPAVQKGEAFSLNMNVQTILSPEFQKFDQALTSLTRSRLVIELQLVDIFADLGGYIFARDYLQEKGYRVCLDGLTHLTLRYVDRARLGADLVKVQWTPDGLNMLSDELMYQFRELVAQTGQARIILCRCEDQIALECGMGAGIIMFQGRHIENLLAMQRDPLRAMEAERTLAGQPTLNAIR